MPLPVLVGIPWLAGIIGSLFSGLFVWFAQFLTKRVAIVAAAVVVIVALTVGMYAALQAIITGIMVAAPMELSVAVGLFLPSNTDTCVAGIVSGRLLHWAYCWKVRIVQYQLF